MKFKRFGYLTLMIAPILFMIFYLRDCSGRDYNWSTNMEIIKGTIKEEPKYCKEKFGSKVEFSINELPCIFVTCGTEYDEYTDKAILDDLIISDTVQVKVLAIDYRNFKAKANSFSIDGKQDMVFYGLLFNGKEFVKIEPEDIEKPDFIFEGLIIFCISMAIFIWNFYNLIDCFEDKVE